MSLYSISLSLSYKAHENWTFKILQKPGFGQMHIFMPSVVRELHYACYLAYTDSPLTCSSWQQDPCGWTSLQLGTPCLWISESTCSIVASVPQGSVNKQQQICDAAVILPIIEWTMNCDTDTTPIAVHVIHLSHKCPCMRYVLHESQKLARVCIAHQAHFHIRTTMST